MSVDRTENKNDRKGLAQVGYCLKYLMNFCVRIRRPDPWSADGCRGQYNICGDAGGGGRDDNTAL